MRCVILILPLTGKPHLALCFLIASTIRATPPADPPKKPLLVLAIVVDQFRFDYPLHFRGDYHAGLACWRPVPSFPTRSTCTPPRKKL
jgi:hypothetical protein